MVGFVLLLILSLITVVRARHQGVAWDEIICFPSQWVHYVAVGGNWGPTFCALVGRHVRDGAPYRPVWIVLQSLINLLFIWKERHHCAESLYRCEKVRKNG